MINNFEKKTLFGTDGIRAPVGMMPFTNESFRALGNALANWFITTYANDARILICHDPRQTAQLLTMNLVGQLLQYPIEIHDAGMLPTPAAHALLQKNNFHCALVISASHNLYQDNGIKIIDAKTGKIGSAEELLISELYTYHLSHLATVPFDQKGSYSVYGNAACDYIQLLREKITIEQPIAHTIVVDTGNGACSSLASRVFDAFGISALLINNSPTGTNINQECGATHPQSMIDAVINNGAFLGFSFDGDGDRMVMADATGNLYTGDEILSLLSQHPRYANEAHIIGTLMSNIGFEQWLAKIGKRLIRANVGDKHVIKEMAKHNALLGGEPSGHIIIRDHLASSDALFAALLLTVLMTTHTVTVGYQRFPQKICNVKTEHTIDVESSTLQAIITDAYDMLGTGRIVIRNSGTERCVRIMVEAASPNALETTMSYLMHEIKKILERNN